MRGSARFHPGEIPAFLELFRKDILTVMRPVTTIKLDIGIHKGGPNYEDQCSQRS